LIDLQNQAKILLSSDEQGFAEEESITDERRNDFDPR